MGDAPHHRVDDPRVGRGGRALDVACDAAHAWESSKFVAIGKQGGGANAERGRGGEEISDFRKKKGK